MSMHIKNSSRVYRTVFIGAGPGGSGPLVCAVQKGQLNHLLDGGIAVLDRTEYIGRGLIGQYVINSDTLSNTFLESLKNQEHGPLVQVLNAPSKRAIEAHAGGPVPLHLVGDYMTDLGAALREQLDRHPHSQFFSHTSATDVCQNSDGTLTTRATIAHADGCEESIELRSQHVVVATGGQQLWARTVNECVAGVPLSPVYEPKIMLTGSLLSRDGPHQAEQMLRSANKNKVVIVGGSHSAFSAAWVLLNKTNLSFDEGDITLLHREKLKLFYPTKEAAWAEGYTDFTDDDICPLTQRVYRLGGFRFDSRELLMRLWGINGRELEKRVRLVKLQSDGNVGNDQAQVKQLLDEAALVVPAFGYRPIAIDMRDAADNPIELMCLGAGTPPLVDGQCRMLDASGSPIPNVFGIGLASGFVPSGKLGGEPSFRGQTNGLWLYQNGVGEIILDQIL